MVILDNNISAGSSGSRSILKDEQQEIIRIRTISRYGHPHDRDRTELSTTALAYPDSGLYLLYVCLLYTSPSPRD